jgi:predicted nucleic acid-binding protein
MSWQDIGEALAAVRVLCPLPTPLTTDTHDLAIRVAEKYGFQFYDALIAAAALEAECTALYSEDFQDGQVIERRLTVRNPFA